MTTVAQVLKVKGHSVWSVSPSATVYEALLLMAEKDVGALVVQDSGSLVGIISERDYVRRAARQGKIPNETPVQEMMTRDVTTIKPEDTIERCMALMTVKRIRHLPVLDKGELVGMISIGDAVKAHISEQESVIGDLQRYISGSRA
jgi:CBS domain-containing protein